MNGQSIATLLYYGNELIYGVDKSYKEHEWHFVMTNCFLFLENYQNLNEFILTLDAKTRIAIDDMINCVYHIINIVKKEKSETKREPLILSQIKIFRQRLFYLVERYSKS